MDSKGCTFRPTGSVGNTLFKVELFITCTRSLFPIFIFYISNLRSVIFPIYNCPIVTVPFIKGSTLSKHRRFRPCSSTEPGPTKAYGSSHHIHSSIAVSYTHLRAHETRHDLVCRLLLEKKKKKKNKYT